MASGSPSELDRLLDATASPEARDAAWSRFVADHTALLLHAARSVDREHDGGLDAFAFVLGKLREDDFRRLRTWRDDGRSRLSTWLLVVARRLSLDYRRQRYGRLRLERGDGASARVEHVARRLLEDLATTPLDDAALEDPALAADATLLSAEIRAALHAALDELPAEDRRLIRMRFEEERTGQEIARTLGLPTPFHAFRRINRILDALRLRLAARGVEDATP